MKILIICPAPRGSRKGNRVTAVRWSRMLRQLGHRVAIRQEYVAGNVDVMVALHARRSAGSIARFAAAYPERPLIVALTGTDLYRDIRTSRRAQRSLALATRLVVLQREGLKELGAAYRKKARVVLQSAEPTPARGKKRRKSSRDSFRVCVLGHLRAEKDPVRTALAARRLPPSSRVLVTHLGAALVPDLQRWAETETARNPRYRWLGELPRRRARRMLAQSDLLVLTSRMEGGANVVSEAIIDGVPIIASRIPGSVGMLGARYPGLFPVGDTAALARLLDRAETDRRFYERLVRHGARLAPQFLPSAERRAWRDIVAELRSGAESS